MKDKDSSMEKYVKWQLKLKKEGDAFKLKHYSSKARSKSKSEALKNKKK